MKHLSKKVVFDPKSHFETANLKYFADILYVQIFPFQSSLRLVSNVLVLILSTGCFLNSKITHLEQKSLTVENKITLVAQISASSLIEGNSFILDLNLDSKSTTDTLIQFSVTGGTSGLTRFSSAPTSALIPAGS